MTAPVQSQILWSLIRRRSAEAWLLVACGLTAMLRVALLFVTYCLRVGGLCVAWSICKDDIPLTCTLHLLDQPKVNRCAVLYSRLVLLALHCLCVGFVRCTRCIRPPPLPVEGADHVVEVTYSVTFPHDCFESPDESNGGMEVDGPQVRKWADRFLVVVASRRACKHMCRR